MLSSNRSELAKSLKAYCKNHFSTGVSSVNCSQYPLLPPEPEQPSQITEDKPTETAEEVEVEKVEGSDEIVTDVVPEQVGSGEEEPAPTPALGEEKKEEVTEEGGLEQVDEDLEELKVDDKKEVDDSVEDVPNEETASSAAAGESASHTPQVTEEETQIPAAEGEAKDDVPPPAAQEPKKQERVDNPIFTLEIAGTKYNPTNFW